MNRDVSTLKPLFFLHVPKTAGSTMLSVIESNYSRDTIFKIWNYSDALNGLKLSKEELKKYNVILGHVPFEFYLASGLEQQFFCTTILREPIDRIVSLYYFILRTPHHYLYHQVCGDRPLSLKEFVASRLTSEIHNGQTRMFSSSLAECYTRYQFEFEELDGRSLEKAKIALKRHFLLVGITEQLEVFLQLSSRIFGWKTIHTERKNVTENRISKENVPSDVKQIIKKNNEIDIELYEYAKRLFDEMAVSKLGKVAQIG